MASTDKMITRLLSTGTLFLGVPLAIAAARLTVRCATARADREEAGLRRTTDELRARNEQLAALSNVFGEIMESVSLQHVVNATLKETLRIMHADVAVLRALEGENLVAVGALTRSGGTIDHLFPVPIGAGNTGVAALERRTMRLNKGAEKSMSTRHLGDTGPSPSSQTGMPQLESGIIAPLIVGARVIGTLACWSRSENAFTADDERMLAMMASQVSTAMIAASTMETTERMAYSDSLTTLPNRLQLDKDLKEDPFATRPTGRHAVVAMVDIDHFKRFNDEFGHKVGDAALRKVASVLRESIRDGDRIYRYGGEEFLLFFLNAAPAEARRLAERLRLAVEQAQLTDAERQAIGPITVSVGLAVVPDHAPDLETAIELADRVMYQAKTRGRNRVATWRRPARRKAA